MSTRLVSPTRIFGTTIAHECYDSLCKKRQVDARMRKEIFSDTVQAFYVAAAVGHLLQRGQRYVVEAKTSKELLSREQWDRPDKKSLKMAFTYLAKLEYNVASDDDVLQVVAELAERGIRQIKDRVSETGDFDFITLIDQLRKETIDEQPPEPGSLDLKGLALQDLLKLNEAWNLEFKSSMLWDYESKKKNDKLCFAIAKTICSLTNSEGGIIVIGVSD
ncbi:ATP-binding protein, partial [Candidatus Bathyarchaeota archaeon]|nr:ATP-binding protein [Candidatus Bathyarchaeota archaeon]